MAPQQSMTVLQFDVKSSDPEKRTILAVREAVKLSADLQTKVNSKYPGTKIKIKRKEGLPVGALIHHLLISIDWHAVASGTEKAIAAFATTEFLKLTKKRIRNLFAAPSPAITATEKKAPAKKRSAKKTVSKAAKSPKKNAVVTTATPPKAVFSSKKKQRG